MADDCIYSLFVQLMPDTTDIESSEDTPTIPCLLYEGKFFISTNNCKGKGDMYSLLVLFYSLQNLIVITLQGMRSSECTKLGRIVMFGCLQYSYCSASVWRFIINCRICDTAFKGLQ